MNLSEKQTNLEELVVALKKYMADLDVEDYDQMMAGLNLEDAIHHLSEAAELIERAAYYQTRKTAKS